MKIIYLLAPSEGKNNGWDFKQESISFEFEKPIDIAINATEKDLKCKAERYKEWIELNKKITSPHPSPTGEGAYIKAIHRYSWVVFNAIWYDNMSEPAKDFFQKNVFILSWMYGILKPLDIIWDYKLPIETKWLYKFWWDKITQVIKDLQPDYIVNLLPNSYAKMIDFKSIDSRLVNINFFKDDGKKMTHWVKKYRWEFLKNACEKYIVDYKDFPWEIDDSANVIEIKMTK